MLSAATPEGGGADDDEVTAKAGFAVRAGARVARVARVVLWSSVAGVAVLFVVSAVVVLVLD